MSLASLCDNTIMAAPNGNYSNQKKSKMKQQTTAYRELVSNQKDFKGIRQDWWLLAQTKVFEGKDPILMPESPWPLGTCAMWC